MLNQLSYPKRGHHIVAYFVAFPSLSIALHRSNAGRSHVGYGFRTADSEDPADDSKAGDMVPWCHVIYVSGDWKTAWWFTETLTHINDC